VNPRPPPQRGCPGGLLLGLLLRGLARLPGPLRNLLASLLEFPGRVLLRRRWRVARVNLARCFPGDPSARLAEHRRAFWRALLDLPRAWFAPVGRLAAEARIEGLDHLREAEAAGQGVLLLSGHLLHTEPGLRALVEALAAPVGILIRRHDRHPCIERLVDGARRARLGPTFGKFETRHLLRHLREGGRVVYLADQDFRESPAFVPFFGIPAATFSGIPELLRAGRARLLFLAVHREATGGYAIRIEPTGLVPLLQDTTAFAAAYMALLEAAVRRDPAQYLWLHRRFKTRPPGEAATHDELQR